jgi:transposase
MHVQAHETLEELQRLRRRPEHRPLADRLQIILLARRGQTAPQIAAAVGLSRRQVQEWVRRYNAQGVTGLQNRPRPGQPPKLPVAQQSAFKARLLAGPAAADGGRCTLRGQDARRILRDEFGVRYSLSGAIELLHRLGLSCLRPRPQHRKQDPTAQARWVEQAPLLSKP